MFSFNLNISKIKKKIVLFIVKRIIGKYVYDVDLDQIEINNNGFIIKELVIIPNVLELFDNIVDFDHGIVTHLEVYIPWSNILTESSKLSIDKITIVFNMNIKEEINVIKLATTVLQETLNLDKFDEYLIESIKEDKEFLLSKKDEYETNKHEDYGFESLKTLIQTFIDNIRLDVGFIDIIIKFPNETDLNLQLYGISIIKNPTNISSNNIDSLLKKRLIIEELVLLTQEKTIISIHNFILNLYKKTEEHQINQYKYLDIFNIDINIDFIYAYASSHILNNIIYIINGTKNQFYMGGSSDIAKSYQINFDMKINRWKFVLELNSTKKLCSLSNNIYISFQNKPVVGMAKPNMEYEVVFSKKDFNFFPLEDSMTPKNESIMASIHSTVAQQITAFNVNVGDWEINEIDNDKSINIIRVLKDCNDFLKISFAGGLFDRINIDLCQLLITVDITIIDRYLSIIKLFDGLENPNKSNHSIFKQKNVIKISCNLIQLILKIPISNNVKKMNQTNSNYYEESLFTDIHDIIIEYTNKSIDITCQKLLGNLLNRDNIINFFSAKAPKKNKPIVIQIFNNNLFDNSNMTVLPEWFHVIRMAIGQQDVEVSQNVKVIDELNKEVMKKSKSILKINLRHANLYLNYSHFHVIDNLISEFLQWQSPFPPMESFYTLSNIRLETLSINITHSRFKYTILAEMINVLSAMNLFTNHKFNYLQIKDLYLYNNETKKFILKKIDSRDPHFIRVGYEQTFPAPSFKENTISIEFYKVKMMMKHEDFSKYEKDTNFWIFDIIDFFKKEYQVTETINSKTKLHINAKLLSMVYKIWNIPSKFQLDLNNVTFINSYSMHDIGCLYSVFTDYLDLSLITDHNNISFLHNKFLNLIWKDNQIELINNSCVIELCSDVFHVIKGILNEFQKINQELIIKDKLDDTYNDVEEVIGCDMNQIKEIERMIDDAIRPVTPVTSFGFPSISAFSIYTLTLKKSITKSYDKLNSILYNSLIEDDNSCFIVRDFNLKLTLYSGIDIDNARNHNIYISFPFDKINMIWFNSCDKNHQKMFIAVRSIDAICFKNNTTQLIKSNMDFSYKSWGMINESDMGLLNHIYCLNGGFQKKATHFLDWSNQFGFVYDKNNSQETTDFYYLLDTQPFSLNLNQDSINMLLDFFNMNTSYLEKYYKLNADYVEVKDMHPENILHSDKTDKLMQHYFIINPIRITINYKSSIFDLSWNKTATILNFVNLDETKLIFDKFEYHNIDLEALGKKLEEHYMSQIKSNNSMNIISSLSPVKTVIKLGTGIVNLVIIPSTEGFKYSKWKYGLQKGVENFKLSTLSELVNIGYKIMTTADKIMNGKKNKEETITLTMPTNEYNTNNLKKVISEFTGNMLKLKNKLSGKERAEELQREYRSLEE
jgi:hypothetical protein